MLQLTEQNSHTVSSVIVDLNNIVFPVIVVLDYVIVIFKYNSYTTF